MLKIGEKEKVRIVQCTKYVAINMRLESQFQPYTHEETPHDPDSWPLIVKALDRPNTKTSIGLTPQDAPPEAESEF